MTDNKKYTLVKFRGERYKVEFLDPGWDGCPLFLFGHEFGPTHLIRADHYGSAWEEWLDEQPPIKKDDLWLAYGFNSEDSYKAFCLLFQMGLKEQAWAIAKSEGIDGSGVSVPEDYPPIIEGYDYQPNATGTGIVDVGHYVWVAQLRNGEWVRI
jgi:hypothetical protein